MEKTERFRWEMSRIWWLITGWVVMTVPGTGPASRADLGVHNLGCIWDPTGHLNMSGAPGEDWAYRRESLGAGRQQGKLWTGRAC